LIRGTGNLKSSITDAASDVENVRILDEMPTEKLARRYAEASVLLAPFEREAFGMAVIESMASGTPVVGLDDGNITNLIDDGRNGYVCDDLNIDEWMDAIDKATKITNGELVRETVREYTWNNVASEYRRIYEQLVV
jgi:glycosyltransferase involved in cell wall biosynthesis